MDEFANMKWRWANDALRLKTSPHATRGMNPVIELIGSLVGDGAGGVIAPAEIPITTDQWLVWNQLALEQEEDLVQAVKEVLELEELKLPQGHEAMRKWAAQLLLSALDRMDLL